MFILKLGTHALSAANNAALMHASGIMKLHPSSVFSSFLFFFPDQIALWFSHDKERKWKVSITRDLLYRMAENHAAVWLCSVFLMPVSGFVVSEVTDLSGWGFSKFSPLSACDSGSGIYFLLWAGCVRTTHAWIRCVLLWDVIACDKHARCANCIRPFTSWFC